MKRRVRLLLAIPRHMVRIEIRGEMDMTEVSRSADLQAEAAEVWSKIGRFDSLPQWHPVVDAGQIEEKDGKVFRVLTIAGGGTLTERLESRDDQGMTYTYSIIEGPLPVQDYVSTITVKPQAEGCIVEWVGKFSAKDATEDKAIQVVDSIYSTGLDALRKQFNS